MKISYYKVYSRKISYEYCRMDENFRFIQLIDELKEKGEIADYVQAASILQTNKAGISDIKNGRKKLSIELLRRMKISYPTINIEWVIMGVGEAFVNSESIKPANISDANTFIDKITEQAEEIGRLRERISQLERKKGKDASDAPTSGVANAG